MPELTNAASSATPEYFSVPLRASLADCLEATTSGRPVPADWRSPDDPCDHPDCVETGIRHILDGPGWRVH